MGLEGIISKAFLPKVKKAIIKNLKLTREDKKLCWFQHFVLMIFIMQCKVLLLQYIIIFVSVLVYYM